jgi:iron complex transport system permease protein
MSAARGVRRGMIRIAGLSLLLVAAVMVTVAAALSFGSEVVSMRDAWQVLMWRAGMGAEPDPIVARIVVDLRLPRVLLALAVGGGLAIIGVAMQTLVRNPLAEPYILGISGGASAGASLFYLGFLPPLLSRALSVPLSAFAGALLAITIVYMVARKHGSVSVTRLLLAGVAMSALMASVTAFVTFASPDPQKLRMVLFWLLGSFAGTRWGMLPLPILASTGGLLLLMILHRPLDAMLTGEEPAFNLGVPVELMKKTLIVLAALVTGILVSAAGVIGFVGLIVPHAVRFLTGVTHRRLLPASFLAGALFMVWADIAARAAVPSLELPVGVVTAICGVPFFLILLRRTEMSLA